MKPILVPEPKQLTVSPGLLELPGDVSLSRVEAGADLAGKPAGAYALEISSDGCTVSAIDDAGAFYARQTLGQLKKQFGTRLPQLRIVDWPDYPVRGLYHDVTRGKVPTLETLKALADYCAGLKLNQLQLYIEHTYAYEAVPEVWADTDPLTRDEILDLDAYCAERHIDLVPSFSTFGHFYPFIHTKRFQHLNELERDVSDEAFSWWDRMMHYTLDCRNPESIELIRTLIAEVRPLFRSELFNICADETFDLGKGRNRGEAEKVGKGRLYVDFVKQVVEIVREQGARPMMWGDIVRNHIDLLPELPEGVTFLDWDYGAELKEVKSGNLADADRPYYVCSGINAWNRFLPNAETANRNIMGLAKHGHEHGATGYLVTDWGDCGHINPLSVSYPGIALAAACAWNVSSCEHAEEELESAISVAVFGDEAGELVATLRQAGAVARLCWRGFGWWLQKRLPDVKDDWFDPDTGLPDIFFETDIAEHAEACRVLQDRTELVRRLLDAANLPDPRIADEMLFALHAALVFEELMMCLLDLAGRNPENLPAPAPEDAARKIASLDTQWQEVWERYNKPSEYYRISEVLRGIVAYLKQTR